MTDGYARLKPSGMRVLRGVNSSAEIAKSSGCDECCECRCTPIVVATFRGDQVGTIDLRPYQHVAFPCNVGGKWRLVDIPGNGSGPAFVVISGDVSPGPPGGPGFRGQLWNLPDSYGISVGDGKAYQLQVCCPAPLNCCRLWGCGVPSCCEPPYAGPATVLGSKAVSFGDPTWDLSPFVDEIVCGDLWQIVRASDNGIVPLQEGFISDYGDLVDLPPAITYPISDTLTLRAQCR